MSGESGRIMYGPDVGLSSREKYYSVLKGRTQGFHAPFPERQLILTLGDLLVIVLATIMVIRIGDIFFSENMSMFQLSERVIAATIFLGIWLAFAFLNDLYDVPVSSRLRTTAHRILLTGLFSSVGFLLASNLLQGPLLPYSALFLLVIIMTAVLVWRIVYIEALRQGVLQHRILILGTGTRALTVMELLETLPDLSFQVVGFVTVEAMPYLPGGIPPRIIGHAKNMSQMVSETNIHEIVLAPDGQLNLDHITCLTACQAKGVRLTFMPDLYARLQRRVPIEEIDVDWALHAIQGQGLCWRLNLAIKRMLDIVLLLVALPLFLLIAPLLALAIRMDTRGPIFYRQIRCGRGAEPFEILKFRTMVSEAEADGIAKWAEANDSRITRVGRILRKSHLDELPQLINVLLGQMSFVGPRPERPEFVAELREQIPYYDARMLVKPGITGWAQVHYDYGNSLADAQIKLQYDFFYINRWSLWMDLYILFRTPAEALKLNGT